VHAGELLVASATTWQRAAGIQNTAQRDAVLRDVNAQWQQFQSLVRESTESGQASPATR
jgi:hypothetical protein